MKDEGRTSSSLAYEGLSVHWSERLNPIAGLRAATENPHKRPVQAMICLAFLPSRSMLLPWYLRLNFCIDRFMSFVPANFDVSCR